MQIILFVLYLHRVTKLSARPFHSVYFRSLLALLRMRLLRTPLTQSELSVSTLQYYYSCTHDYSCSYCSTLNQCGHTQVKKSLLHQETSYLFTNKRFSLVFFNPGRSKSEHMLFTTDTVITNCKQYTKLLIQSQTAIHAPYIKEIKDSDVKGSLSLSREGECGSSVQ